MHPGDRIAHYEILSAIGRGGMGEVWRAEDTKLGRQVAIKALPETFARDADRLARFEREAKLLASLNHPNIAAIYGLEEQEGKRFLILELVEGGTLADRISGGAIPVEEALALAVQVADALEAAHEKGVVHRDLKPANIKVTSDGKVKVLDFGLAKAFTNTSDAHTSQSPTISMATQQGVILGTAAYMSPEQARGREVDKRTDIWAFGCVLFEMLCGKAAFPGADVTDILAAVVRAEPGWDGLPAGLPPKLREILERCLEKDPRNRRRDIGDVRVDIERVQAHPEAPAGIHADPGSRSRSAFARSVPWAAVTVLAILAAGAASVWLKPAGAPRLSRFFITTQEGDHQELLGLTSGYDMRLSPDGSEFVYLGRRDGITRLYRRRLDSFGSTVLAGTEGAYEPFFSPDGQQLAFLSGSTLKRMPFPAGATLNVAAPTLRWTFLPTAGESLRTLMGALGSTTSKTAT
jgi:serine/threonine-protein kinase